MKVFWLTNCFLFISSVSLIGQSLVSIAYIRGQSYYGGSAATTGFGEIGVVANENNYHSAYFQNPALLARNKDKVDVFVNLPATESGFGISSGAMINFNKNAIGIGMERTVSNNSGHYTHIPILYARNLYHTKKAGISIGGNLNIYDEEVIKSQKGTGIVTEDINFISGGFGIDAYRLGQLTERQTLRINTAFSINNLGSNTQTSLNNDVFVRSRYRIGLLADWRYSLSKSKSLVVTMGIQLNANPALIVNLTPTFIDNFIPNTRHLGSEVSYFWARGKFVTIRGGFVWNVYDRTYGASLEQRNYSVGATVNIKGVYLHLAVIPEEDRSFNSLLHASVGYQANLNRKKKTVPPNLLEIL